MVECTALKDFYYTKTKTAYREGRKYLFTKEQFEELYSAGLVISEIKKDTKEKEIKIKKPKKIIKYNA